MASDRVTLGNGAVNSPTSSKNILDSPQTHSIAKSPFKPLKGGKGSGK